MIINTKNINQLHFIIGIGRSGTTLLMKMLNEHKQLKAIPEGNFFYFFYNNWKLKKKFTLKDLSYLSKYLNYFPFKEELYEISNKENKPSNIFKTQINSSFKRIYSDFLFNTCLDETIPSKNILLLKNPLNSLYIDEILNEFPDSKFIVLTRDPRANCLSRKQKAKFRNKDIYYNSLRYNKFMETILNAQLKYPNHFIFIKYEDLVKEPEIELTKLTSFFNIDYQASMLDFYLTVEKTAFNFVSNSKKENHEQLFTKYKDLSTPINTNRIDAWKTDLTKTEVDIISSICAKTANKLGYNDLNFNPSIISNLELLKSKYKLWKEFFKLKLIFYSPLKLKISRLKNSKR